MADTADTKSFSIGWIVWIFAIIILLGIALFFIGVVNTDDKPKAKAKITGKEGVTQKRSRNGRILSGTFKLPADGTIVWLDIKGKKLHFKKGGWIRLDQLSSPSRRYGWINHKIPSWSTKGKTRKTGPHTGDGIVELRSISGHDMLVKATIL